MYIYIHIYIYIYTLYIYRGIQRVTKGFKVARLCLLRKYFLACLWDAFAAASEAAAAAGLLSSVQGRKNEEGTLMHDNQMLPAACNSMFVVADWAAP